MCLYVQEPLLPPKFVKVSPKLRASLSTLLQEVRPTTVHQSKVRKLNLNSMSHTWCWSWISGLCLYNDEPSSVAWMIIFLKQKWRLPRVATGFSGWSAPTGRDSPPWLPGRSPHRSPIGRPVSPSEDGYGHSNFSAMWWQRVIACVNITRGIQGYNYYNWGGYNCGL